MPPPASDNSFSFKVTSPDKLQQDVPLMVYVFDKSGKSLFSGTVKDGTAQLPLNEKTLMQSRIFFSPSPDKIRQQKTVPTIEQLLQARAYEPVLQAAGKLKDLVAIPKEIFIFWLWRKCHVNGKVTTRINQQGIFQNLPVCNARVHICEIDFWFFWRLPDFVIERIRWEWWNVFKPKIKFPFKVPEGVIRPVPRPDPIPFGKPNLKLSDLQLKDDILKAGQLTTPVVAQQFFSVNKNLNSLITGKAPLLDPQQISVKMPPLLTMDQRAEAQMSSLSLTDVRQALVSNVTWFRPWFCYWWPWLRPHFYSSQELAVVQTNDQGNYEADIWYQVFGDKPDIYVWVEYLIDGNWATVYRPSIPCFTFWDYICGTPINITITDPRVPPCDHITHLPGAFVEVKRIGSGVMIQEISQGNAAVDPPKIPPAITVQGRTLNTIGLTKWKTDDHRCPFGDTLGLKVIFGDDTLIAANATHYRWSYHKIATSVNLNGNHTPVADTTLGPISNSDTGWQILTTDPGLLYRLRYTDSSGDIQEITKNLPLLDASVNETIFLIPRENINQMITAAPGTSVHYADQDWMSGWFKTNGLDDGLYELKLELFRKSGVNIIRTDIDRASWKVPTKLNPNLTENAPATYYYNPAAAPVNTVQGFKFKVRVDNNLVVAAIDNIRVDGNTSTTLCGFVQYASADPLNPSMPVIGFEASHPNDFATFGFSITRGNGNPTANTDAAGMTIGDTNGYTAVAEDIAVPPNDAGNLVLQHYTKAVNINDLLGRCPKAAFAEVLNVGSLATNGSNGTPLYSATAVAAFALEPVGS